MQAVRLASPASRYFRQVREEADWELPSCRPEAREMFGEPLPVVAIQPVVPVARHLSQGFDRGPGVMPDQSQEAFSVLGSRDGFARV